MLWNARRLGNMADQLIEKGNALLVLNIEDVGQVFDSLHGNSEPTNGMIRCPIAIRNSRNSVGLNMECARE